mgnify:CR=1 FL=1
MRYRLLWVDDEIELLKAHILFLEKKGYNVQTVTNGYDALDLCAEVPFDLILLDENMPGINGLETLNRIKEITPNTPIVMVTKSEEENIMEQAIGKNIADYLIKPVNPNQILLCLKKHIHQNHIIKAETTKTYQEEFSDISYMIDTASTMDEFMAIHRTLVHWELKLQDIDSSMKVILQQQRQQANSAFFKFISKIDLIFLIKAVERLSFTFTENTEEEAVAAEEPEDPVQW